jgi:competence/damage-inducible protein CinA-like protein
MPSPTAEIFSQGDEVVTGLIADTNAAWLSRELVDLGFDVARHTAVGDRLGALADLLREIAGRADLCLCTGGLGPTSDDLTAEAVSLAFGLPLDLDLEALAQIEGWFARTGRDMPAVNRKQALLPRGAERLDNLWGTAPGFALSAGRCRFAFMPGVPGEMKAMFQRFVAPNLPARFALRPPRRVVLNTVGLGESALQERLDRIGLPGEIILGFHAGGPENRVKLLFPSEFPRAEADAWVARAAEAIGAAVFAIGEGTAGESGLEEAVGAALARRGRLFVVETASGGALARRCAAAEWFAGATVAADPGGLAEAAGRAGADPGLATRELAAEFRRRGAAEHVLAQFGDFTAADLRAEDTRVEVHFALAGPGETRGESRWLNGALARKQNSAAALALDFVRRTLSGKPGDT